MHGSLLSDAFEHHVWATLRLLETCLTLSRAQLESGVPGTYGTILETLRHTVGADASYLSVLTDGQVAEIDEATMGLPDLRAVMERNGPAWATFLAGEIDPEAMVTRYREDGSESGAPAGIRVAQVLHHGTDHRSQICTALTSLGIEPPEIDVWAFAHEQGRLVEVGPPSS